MHRQATQAICPSRFLGERNERQRHHRAADKRYELAPSHFIALKAEHSLTYASNPCASQQYAR
jgi:hypothetical protein